MTDHWQVSSLDMELRYAPVVRALPIGTGAVCEIGSGPTGLAEWTSRPVIGVDPEPQDKVAPPNLRYMRAHGQEIPLPDRSVRAAVAVDTLEHVPRDGRAEVVAEMKRVVVDGGRLLINGPAGPAASAGDKRVLAMLRTRGLHGNSARWLEEHLRNGLPTVAETLAWLGSDRVRRVTVQGVFNLHLWYVTHLAAMGAIPRMGPLHPVVWRPFAAVARRLHCEPCYRQLIVADIG